MIFATLTPVIAALAVSLPGCTTLLGSKAIVAPQTVVAAPDAFVAQRTELERGTMVEVIIVRALPPLDHLQAGSMFLTWADPDRAHLVGGVVGVARKGAPLPDGTPTTYAYMDLARTAAGDPFSRIDLDSTDTQLAAIPQLCREGAISSVP